MMQHLDTDIDLALDDREPELVYETNVWGRLFQRAAIAVILPALVAVFADMTDRQTLLTGAFVAFWALFALAVFGLVMEYRADSRTPEAGGHGA